jgi:YD repeat-containing protein
LIYPFQPPFCNETGLSVSRYQSSQPFITHQQPFFPNDMKKQKLAGWLLAITLLLPFGSTAQQNVLPKIMPVSPNAAALGSYGHIPVSMYTGIPGITLPLYEIRSGSLSLPVSLGYRGGGIKVEEIASSVGQGWVFNGGGVITRSIAGMDDYSPDNGYMHQVYPLKAIVEGQYGTTEQQLRLKQIINGQYDGEPDVYYFNIGGLSGKFFYNQETQTFLQSPMQDITITHDNQLLTWVLTDKNGIAYSFAHVETNAQGSTTKTAWHISGIEDTKTHSQITFQYEPYHPLFTTFGTESSTVPFPNQCTAAANSSTQVNNSLSAISSWRLTRINFANGSVRLLRAAQPRYDLDGDYPTASIEIYNDERRLKKYVLQYSYFKEDPSLVIADPANKTRVRLKLDGVEEWPGDTAQATPKLHKFTYYGNGFMPGRMSYAQDHWGYANSNTAPTLIPEMVLPGSSPAQDVWMPGAMREATPGFALNGVLEQITYPTGGSTVFVYEQNTVKGSTSVNLSDGLRLDAPASCVNDENNNNAVVLQNMYYEQVFTIDSVHTRNQPLLQYLQVACSGYDMSSYATCLGNPGAMADPPAVQLVNMAQPQTDLLQMGITGNYQTVKTLYDLPLGTYKIKVQYSFNGPSNMAQCYCDAYGAFSVNISFPPRPGQNIVNRYVGGLRIRTITDNDSAGNRYTTRYDYAGADGLSSGVAQSVPQYAYKAFRGTFGGNSPESGNACYFLKRFSVSNYPLVSTQGRPVGYAQVTVTKTDGNGADMGKSVHHFSTLETVGDVVNTQYPFCPNTSFDWKRGLPLTEQHYRRADSVYQMVKTTETVYDHVLNGMVPERRSFGVKAGLLLANFADVVYEGPIGPAGQPDPFPMEVTWQGYEQVSDCWLPVQKTEINYAATGNTVTNQQQVSLLYNGNAHLEATQTGSRSGTGDSLITYTRYAGDYTLTAGSSYTNTGGIKQMQETGLNLPVETWTVRVRNGVEQVLSATLITRMADRGLPATTYTCRLAKALPIDSFRVSHINTAGALVMDSRYQPLLQYDAYSFAGNILQQQKTGDQPLAYLWDYNDAYVVAEVSNATTTDIAYTSFEANDKGNWNYSGAAQAAVAAPTGRAVYALQNGAVSRSGLSPGRQYQVYAWVQDAAGMLVNGQSPQVVQTANGWLLCRVVLPTGLTTVTVSGSTLIDELRLYPVDAAMCTLTYDPLVGITSNCDAQQRITYFEYDGFGRLAVVRDGERKVLKTLLYQYKIQP